MKIIFVSREPELCAMLASRVENESIQCSIKNNFLEFLLLLKNDKIDCDLLVCDFCQVQHMLCSIADLLRRASQIIPVIFYNDPYPTKENRVVYWLSQNESLYTDREFHHLIPVFKTINAIIENPAVRPYISLLQPPLPVSGVTMNSEEIEDPLLHFRIRNKIPPSLFSVFELFYRNICKELSIKEISKRISKGYFHSSLKRASVYSYVSRLKKYMQNDPLAQYDIIRSSFGRYKMVQHGLV
ncbi:MAG: hypothetical protein IJP62_06030 [Treponema sp.]|nr:hypothetical protein [Treponema sp.]